MKKKYTEVHALPKNCKFFGGELLVGRRKSQRPLAGKQALHVVVRSQWAKGVNAFTRWGNRKPIEEIILKLAEQHQVRVYRFGIASNHIHLIVRARSRWLYRAFICNLTGQIAQHIMKKKSFKEFINQIGGEGVVIHKGQAFWEHRPFTRILKWGGDFLTCMKYVLKNSLEALGLIKYTARVDHYAQWKRKPAPA